jgi:hypothetical protein
VILAYLLIDVAQMAQAILSFCSGMADFGHYLIWRKHAISPLAKGGAGR